MTARPRRWVVLSHTGHGPDHHDVMIERAPGGELATWRARRWPPTPGDALEPLPDHRRAYLDYEGPISGGRGRVRRVASGTAGENWSDAAGTFALAEDGGTWRVARPPQVPR